MHRDDDQPIVPIDEITKPAGKEPVPVEVNAYSGGRADERPLSFVRDGRKVDILEILFAWIEENQDGSGRRYCYEIVTAEHDRAVLVYYIDDGAWLLREP